VSESLQARLRSSLADQRSATAQQASLNRIEGIHDPLGDTNLGALVAQFFSAVSNLQNNPHNSATRGIVVSAAQATVDRVGGIRSDLLALRDDLNTDIASAVDQADQIATQIAALNTQITTSEAASHSPASALRDQRDQLLSQLSEYFSITVREQPSGAVNVYIGNEALVQFATSAGLKSVQEVGPDGLLTTGVRFKINNGQVQSSAGQVQGMIAARDSHVATQLSRLDGLVTSLIGEVNRLHAGGRGLSGFSDLTGLSSILDPTASLSSALSGNPTEPATGSFFIDVQDTTTGQTVRHQINVDLDGIGSDTTLNSLIADINANVPGVSATLLSDGRLQLASSAGVEFSFADDTSGALASLGLNNFFSGTDSSDFAVNPLVANNPSLLAAARSNLAGDGSNAGAIALMKDRVITSLGGVSFNDYYSNTVAEMAVSAAGAQNAMDASSIVFDSLSVQRESVSGVNLDEEAVSMLSYQRAYQGAAKFMQVIDEMLDVLINLVR
jgi:flagellar hook-associated protein 1 FlgK